MNFAVYIGNPALTQARNEQFQQKWQALHQQCPWVTVFQHPDFVMPWYELYHTNFVPVILVAESDDRSFSGLLTLAFCKKSNRLVGAGERQAEYQAWLEHPDTANAFIEQGVQLLRTHFPGADLCLRYLPPHISVKNLFQKQHYANLCRFRRHLRPLMKVDESAMRAQLQKKNNRQNVNRLKRIGDVKFERVTKHDEFVVVFDEMCWQYDFRQGALYQQLPFSLDPLKKPFILELHKRGLLHATILTVGGKLAASHCGLVSNNQVLHLGINSHEPTFAAHSPGTLFIGMLGLHLARERIGMLDLTPGGDSYKEHFATEHDIVSELVIYGELTACLRQESVLQAKRVIKKTAGQFGFRTADAFALLRKLTKIRQTALPQALRRTVPLPVSSMLLHKPYSEAPASPCRARPISISKNSLSALATVDFAPIAATRWEFLSIATKRLERNNHFYSYAHEQRIGICCWVGTPDSGKNHPPRESADALMRDAIVLYDLYVDEQLDDSEMVQCFIEHVLGDMRGLQHTPNIYFSGQVNDALKTIIRRCGFSDAATV